MTTITTTDAPPTAPDRSIDSPATGGPAVPAAPNTAAWIAELPAELVDAVRRFQQEHRERDFVVIYRYYAQRLLGYFRRKGVSGANDADLSQEVWLRVAKGLSGFRWEAPLGAWIFTIACNVYLKHVQRDRPLVVESQVDPDAVPDDDNLLQRLIDADTRARILVAIDAMPAQMRGCMRLRYLQDLSYRDIAELMQLAIETVAAHIHQGKERLIRLLRPAT